MADNLEILIELLQQVREARATAWTFYIIIITTAFSIAFTNMYRKLDTWMKVILSLALGASVWYNFFALVGISNHIIEIVNLIENTVGPSSPLAPLFVSTSRYGGNSIEIYAVYIPVNLALGAVMWLDEINELRKKYIEKKEAV